MDLLKLVLVLCVPICGHVCTTVCVWWSEDNFWDFLFDPCWVLGVELRSWDSGAGNFTYGVLTSPNLQVLNWLTTHCFTTSSWHSLCHLSVACHDHDHGGDPQPWLLCLPLAITIIMLTMSHDCHGDPQPWPLCWPWASISSLQIMRKVRSP